MSQVQGQRAPHRRAGRIGRNPKRRRVLLAAGGVGVLAHSGITSSRDHTVKAVPYLPSARSPPSPTTEKYPMTIQYELLPDRGILELLPEGPLEATDFTSLSSQVDSYLAEHGKLHGVLIRTKSFPGWKDFPAMLTHFQFLKDHIKRIEKVAVVADGAVANVMPRIGNHFVHAQVRHFDYMQAIEAMNWIDQSSETNLNAAAGSNEPHSSFQGDSA